MCKCGFRGAHRNDLFLACSGQNIDDVSARQKADTDIYFQIFLQGMNFAYLAENIAGLVGFRVRWL